MKEWSVAFGQGLGFALAWLAEEIDLKAAVWEKSVYYIFAVIPRCVRCHNHSAFLNFHFICAFSGAFLLPVFP